MFGIFLFIFALIISFKFLLHNVLHIFFQRLTRKIFVSPSFSAVFSQKDHLLLAILLDLHFTAISILPSLSLLFWYYMLMSSFFAYLAILRLSPGLLELIYIFMP